MAQANIKERIKEMRLRVLAEPLEDVTVQDGEPHLDAEIEIAMPDANYGCFGACGHNDTNPNIGITNGGTSADPTTTALRWCVCVNYNSSLSDEKRITMAIIR